MTFEEEEGGFMVYLLHFRLLSLISFSLSFPLSGDEMNEESCLYIYVIQYFSLLQLHMNKFAFTLGQGVRK